MNDAAPQTPEDVPQGEPQFEFGFSPEFGTFYDTTPLEKIDGGVSNLHRRLTNALASNQSRLQTDVLGMKEKIRRGRRDRLGGTIQSFGNLTAGGKIKVNTSTTQLANKVNQFVGDNKIKASPARPDLPLYQAFGGNPILPAEPGAPNKGEYPVLLPKLPTDLLPIVGVPALPGGGISGVMSGVGASVIGGAIGGNDVGAGAGIVTDGGDAVVGGAGVAGNVIPGADNPPPAPPSDGSVTETPGPVSGRPDPSACKLLGDKIYAGNEPLTADEITVWQACNAYGWDIETAQYPQEKAPPQAEANPLLPGDPGYPYDPTDPNYGKPYVPPSPVPEEPIERPLPPVPEPGRPTPELPVPGTPKTTQINVNIPPINVNIPDIKLPPIPQQGCPEKPQRRVAPIPPPQVQLDSVTNCFGGPGAIIDIKQSVGQLFSQMVAGGGIFQGVDTTWLQFLNGPDKLVGSSIGGLITNVSEFLDGLIKTFQTAFRCSDPEMLGLISQGLFNGVLERWLTDIPDYLQRPTTYRANFKCPTTIPNTNEATSAYLGDTIDKETLECWVRSNGNMFPEWERIVRASRSKLVPADLIALLRREKITPEEYSKRVREQGYLDSEDSEIEELSKPIPGIQDLVRFMVRDVADKDLVQRFKLDADFDKKWQGDVKQWGEWQGFTEELALPYWVAHWEIPSPTQLYEMYHRLRALPEGDPRYVSEEDIRTALEQQDIAPYWVDKFLAISFNPLTRVDVRRAFDIGVLGRSDVKTAYQFRGYNDKDAETLTEFTVRLKLKRGRSVKPAKDYVAGFIGGAELSRGLSELGYSEEEQQQLIPQIKHDADIEVRKKCIPSIRQRFLLGEITELEARKEAMGHLEDDDQVSRLVKRWDCERAAKGKVLPLTKLSSMFKEGIINSGQLFERLLNLNYSATDAGLILNQLESTIQRKRSAQQEAAIKKRVADEKKANAEADKRAKSEQQKLVKAAKMRERQQKTYDSYRKVVLGAAKSFSAVLDTDIADEFNYLWNLKNDLIGSTGESEPFVIQVLSVVAKSAGYETRQEYVDEVTQIVESGEAAFDQALFEQSTGSSNTSG